MTSLPSAPMLEDASFEPARPNSDNPSGRVLDSILDNKAADSCSSVDSPVVDCPVVDCLIVGGGPVGLFAAFMCGINGLSTTLIEALPVLGGQCQALYPDKPIYDVPGCPAILAQDLVARLCEQMAPFRPPVVLGHKASTLERDPQGQWNVVTDLGKTLRARTLLITSGGGALEPTKIPLPEAQAFENEGILYCVPHNYDFSGKTVVIAGGGDSAVDWAILLAERANQVHMVHRRKDFRAQDHSVEQLRQLIQEGRVKLHAPYQLAGICSQEGRLTGVQVADFSGQTLSLDADLLLPFFGLRACLGPMANWSMSIDQDRIVIDPTTGKTSVDGLYAAGDVATYPHKLKLIMTGFAEVAQATHHIKGYIYPERAHSFQHSTSIGLPVGTP
jgi:thioredoxin reductase (NADPH)